MIFSYHCVPGPGMWPTEQTPCANGLADSTSTRHTPKTGWKPPQAAAESFSTGRNPQPSLTSQRVTTYVPTLCCFSPTHCCQTSFPRLLLLARPLPCPPRGGAWGRWGDGRPHPGLRGRQRRGKWGGQPLTAAAPSAGLQFPWGSAGRRAEIRHPPLAVGKRFGASPQHGGRGGAAGGGTAGGPRRSGAKGVLGRPEVTAGEAGGGGGGKALPATGLCFGGCAGGCRPRGVQRTPSPRPGWQAGGAVQG